jgi:hypothetical protein
MRQGKCGNSSREKTKIDNANACDFVFLLAFCGYVGRSRAFPTGFQMDSGLAIGPLRRPAGAAL